MGGKVPERQLHWVTFSAANESNILLRKSYGGQGCVTFARQRPAGRKDSFGGYNNGHGSGQA